MNHLRRTSRLACGTSRRTTAGLNLALVTLHWPMLRSLSHRSPRPVLAAVLVGLPAAGCGQSASEPSHEPVHRATPVARHAAVHVLKIRRPATVEVQPPGPLGVFSPTAKLRITVTGLTRGALVPGGFRQYYLRYRVTNLGHNLPVAATQFVLTPDLKTAGGLEGSGMCLGSGCTASSPSCPQTPPSHAFPHGKTWDLCSVYLLSAPPSGVVYGPDGDSVSVTAASQ